MSIRFPFLLALVAVLALSACDKLNSALGNAPAKDPDAQTASTPAISDSSQNALFANPQTGDLYAAEITYFSGAEFGGDVNNVVYGLMRVIAVDNEKITLNTEMNGWPKPRGAINDLRGDLNNVEWDDEEEIVIRRSELQKLIADKKILEARRVG